VNALIAVGSGHGGTHLDLEDVVAAEAGVVHLVVGVICVAAGFVFDECETVERGAIQSRDL